MLQKKIFLVTLKEKIICDVYNKYLNAVDVRKEYYQFVSCFDELDKTQSLPGSLHGEDNKSESEQSLLQVPEPEDSSSNSDDDDPKEEQNLKTLNAGSLPEIFKIFCKSRLQVVFLNLHVLLKIAVTIPVTSTSTERSFSKLKRIKTDLRSTIGGTRLEGLLIISSEQDIELNYDEIINIFARTSPLFETDLLM